MRASQIHNQPWKGYEMSDLQKLFVEVVNSELVKQLIEAGDEVPYTKEALENNINFCFRLMVALEQEGQTFDHQAYSDNVLKEIKSTSDSQTVMTVFREYCHFQSMVLILQEFESLLRRFRRAGLGSWTKLRVDKRTLRPFSLSLVQQMESVVERGGAFQPGSEVEVAELISQVADLFDIRLSVRLRFLIESQLDKTLLFGSDSSVAVSPSLKN